MNIKQAEELSGVSRQNIRYYEREGLLCPDRNPENDYRQYNETHIDTLRKIRTLRSLGMPIDLIRQVLHSEISLSEAGERQLQALENEREKLTLAISLCKELMHAESLELWDADLMASKIENAGRGSTFFRKWIDDYRQVVLAESRKRFTFIPDSPVTSASEFTEVLFDYARRHDLDLVITRESMYPEFTIDGIEYTAERFYASVKGIPVATISCKLKYPEDFEANVPERRKNYMKLLNFSWVLLPLGLVLLPWLFSVQWRELLSGWKGWLMLFALVILLLTGAYRLWLFHFNEKQ